MKRNDEIGLHALYDRHGDKADQLIWGRTSSPTTRRGFLGRAGLAAMSAAVGASIPYWQNFPAGLIPAALANTTEAFRIPGKRPGLIVLNDRPINAETPAHLLDPERTPADVLFVRNNGNPPSQVDTERWSLRIDGESVSQTQIIRLADLKTRFKIHRTAAVLECAGNGRKEFFPPAKGNQWSTGAVGCVEWTGVRLRDVLKTVGIRDNAVYVAFEGADTHLSGDPKKKPISRGVPIAKAMDDHCLLAWEMNGAPIPPLHGYPLRLVVPGYPGSCSGKWLNRIMVRNRVHDGPKMTGYAYRIPCRPVAPGTQVPKTDMCIIEAMPTKSLITYPRSGIECDVNRKLDLRGHAWSGQAAVQSMAISIDFGATWQTAQLGPLSHQFAWRRWTSSVRLPKPGYYEIWARATDATGSSQPMILPGWNPKGYLNNACHRIAVRAR